MCVCVEEGGGACKKTTTFKSCTSYIFIRNLKQNQTKHTHILKPKLLQYNTQTMHKM